MMTTCIEKQETPAPGIASDWLTEFLASRRRGLSPHTLAFYRQCLTPFTDYWAETSSIDDLTPRTIAGFLAGLPCSPGGKLAYYRAIRVFCNWLTRSRYLIDNPIRRVDPPKPARAILPSLVEPQVDYLIEHTVSLRDKAIVSLFFDSGLRLSELVSLKAGDIDWSNYTMTVWGKGHKQRRAVFSQKTAELARECCFTGAICEALPQAANRTDMVASPEGRTGSSLQGGRPDA